LLDQRADFLKGQFISGVIVRLDRTISTAKITVTRKKEAKPVNFHIMTNLLVVRKQKKERKKNLIHASL